MSRKHCAGVIVEKNNKILLFKRNFKPSKNKLDLVGGFIEKKESIKQAAVREAREETGYNVKLIEKLISLDSFEREEKTLHIFIAKIIDGKLDNSIEGESVWLDINDIKKDVLAFPHTYKILKKYLEYRNFKK